MSKKNEVRRSKIVTNVIIVMIAIIVVIAIVILVKTTRQNKSFDDYENNITITNDEQNIYEVKITKQFDDNTINSIADEFMREYNYDSYEILLSYKNSVKNTMYYNIRFDSDEYSISVELDTNDITILYLESEEY